jgi:hypothetical protein
MVFLTSSYHFVAGVESETDANATIVETEQSRRIHLEKKISGPRPKLIQRTEPKVASLAAQDKRGCLGWELMADYSLNPFNSLTTSRIPLSPP